MRLKWALAIAAVVAALTGPGCGEDGRAAAASKDDVVSCIRDAGLTADELPEPKGETGPEQQGPADTITVPVESRNAVIVHFFDNPDDAQSYAEGQGAFLRGAGGGGSEVVEETTVVGVARPGADEELAIVKECIS